VTGHRLDLTHCPDPACGVPAEVVRRWSLGSTSGPLPMAQTTCVYRHVFVLPVARLPAPAGPPGRLAA
jgi:hypothetical protein